MPKSDVLKQLKINKHYYVLMAPFMILFTVFTVAPFITSIVLSFTYFNMLEMPRWVGFLNYIKLFFDDDVFLIAVKNTLIFFFITGPVSYLLCWLLAWFINDFPPKVRTILTFIFYVPSIAGNVFFIWGFIFSGDAYGLINGWLMRLGIITEPIQWLLNPEYNLKVIVGIQLWLSLGVSFLAFIAGLQSIDKSLFEAGAIDGIKNRWQELWYVTLPAIKPQLLFGAVMQIAATFAVAQVPMALAGFPSINYSAHTVVAHIIDYGTIRFEMGYASAISTVLFITMIFTKYVITALINKFGN